MQEELNKGPGPTQHRYQQYPYRQLQSSSPPAASSLSSPGGDNRSPVKGVKTTPTLRETGHTRGHSRTAAFSAFYTPVPRSLRALKHLSVRHFHRQEERRSGISSRCHLGSSGELFALSWKAISATATANRGQISPAQASPPPVRQAGGLRWGQLPHGHPATTALPLALVLRSDQAAAGRMSSFLQTTKASKCSVLCQCREKFPFLSRR